MPNIFQHVRSGEPLVIPAGAYNAMLDAAQGQLNRRINLNPHGSGFDSLYIHVVNDTGQFLPRFSVIGLDEPLNTADENAFYQPVVFKGVVPQDRHQNKFAVIQQDAVPDMTVRACLNGITAVKILSPVSADEKCGIVPGHPEGVGAGDVAQVLWTDSQRWAVIRLGGGGTGAAPIYATVMTPIACPPDRTADPSQRDFAAATGDIKIEGKLYETKGGQTLPFDKGACRLLAQSEKLLPGAYYEVARSKYTDSLGNIQPYYVAVNPPNVYNAKLDKDVLSGEKGSFTIKDRHGKNYQFTCTGTMIPSGKKVSASYSYMIERQRTNEDYELVIVGGPCPEDEYV
ncbi:hypothetical protein FACS189454_07460 [Planctomycetales bacterium]|nr:hypothetical protein FACS189454_07460 [Planctomycetales bacterium]